MLDAGRTITLQYQTRSTCTEPHLTRYGWVRPVRASMGLDIAPLLKRGTHLLASSDIMKNNWSSFACLRNAGSYFAVTYCARCLKTVVCGDKGRQTTLRPKGASVAAGFAQSSQFFSAKLSIFHWTRNLEIHSIAAYDCSCHTLLSVHMHETTMLLEIESEQLIVCIVRLAVGVIAGADRTGVSDPAYKERRYLVTAGVSVAIDCLDMQQWVLLASTFAMTLKPDSRRRMKAKRAEVQCRQSIAGSLRI